MVGERARIPLKRRPIADDRRTSSPACGTVRQSGRSSAGCGTGFRRPSRQRRTPRQARAAAAGQRPSANIGGVLQLAIMSDREGRNDRRLRPIPDPISGLRLFDSDTTDGLSRYARTCRTSSGLAWARRTSLAYCNSIPSSFRSTPSTGGPYSRSTGGAATRTYRNGYALVCERIRRPARGATLPLTEIPGGAKRLGRTAAEVESPPNAALT